MEYDSLIIGPVSLDINIDCEGTTRRELGGAVVASGYAAAGCGFRTAVLTKANSDEADAEERFTDSGVDVYVRESAHTCSIQNRYLTPDQDRRICTSLGICDPFTAADLDAIPNVHAQIYHFGGLVCGDIDETLIQVASGIGRTAVDMQGFLRCVTSDHRMKLHDWDKKYIYLPYIHYLKADAAEAEILTGTDDRHEAARMLSSWGAREIMITNSDEVLIYDGERFYADIPLRESVQ